MEKSSSTVAQQIAQAAIAFQKQTTGHAPTSATVVLNEDMVVIALRGALSPAEKALVKSPTGAAKLQEYHRHLFANTSGALRAEIENITGVPVREATVEVETITGTATEVSVTGSVVQVFFLARSLPPEVWAGRGSKDPPP